MLVNIAYVLMLIAFSLCIYWNYRNKQKATKLLESREEETSTLQAELISLKKVKSRIFTNVSHEMRSPLNLMSSPIEAIKNSSTEDFSSDNRTHLDLIERNIEKLQSLIDNISEFSKLESDKIETKPDQIDIHSDLKQIWGNYKHLAERLNIHCQIQLAKLPKSHLSLDIQKLDRALSNLLSYTIKHTPAEGKVIFEAKKEGNRLILQVTGTGINPKNLLYIFDPYFQGNQPNASLQESMCLELALIKEYTQLMEDSLIATSKINQGSSFTINLPYKKVEVEQRIAKELQETSPPIETKLRSSKKPKILIVEDDELTQVVIANILRKKYEPTKVFNGIQALTYLEKHKVDLIISDIMMPEMDGYTLIDTLRKSEKHRYMPVIIITALKGNINRLKFINIGVDDYLTKPFTAKELLTRTQVMLERSAVKKSTLLKS